MNQKNTEQIQPLQMLKSMLLKIYYKLCLEEDDKMLNQYLILSFPEINEMLNTIRCFSSISLIAEQTNIRDGFLFIHARYGVILPAFEGKSKKNLEIEIINSVKNYYLKAKNIDVYARVDSLCHNHLLIAIPVSKFGYRKYIETERLKDKCTLNQQKKEAQKKDRLYKALKEKERN